MVNQTNMGTATRPRKTRERKSLLKIIINLIKGKYGRSKT